MELTPTNITKIIYGIILAITGLSSLTIHIHGLENSSNWIALYIEIGFGLVIAIIVQRQGKRTEKRIIKRVDTILNIKNKENIEFLERISELIGVVGWAFWHRWHLIFSNYDHEYEVSFLVAKKYLEKLIELKSRIKNREISMSIDRNVKDAKEILENTERLFHKTDKQLEQDKVIKKAKGIGKELRHTEKEIDKIIESMKRDESTNQSDNIL
jgi:hypothetical protein